MVKPSNSRRRNSYYEENTPQFFKVYVPTHSSSQRLRIPPAFITNFKGVLPSKSMLTTSLGKTSWCIDVNKVGKYFFFQKGWPEFVRDNSLEFGDFLVFCYTGNSEFYVPIFGKNNCRKEVPITTRDNDKPRPVLQGSRTVEASKSEDKMCVDNTLETGATRMPSQENIGDVGTPGKLGSKKPFFEAIVKPACIYSGLMHIPMEFVKSYMSTRRQTARLRYSNKSWLVKLIPHGKGLLFSGGWRNFQADNTLQEGDVCRFELIRRNDYAFKVAILRGNGTTPCTKAQGNKSTRPRREEGKSKEIEGLNSSMEDSKGTVEANTEDASSKFISKHPFFQIVLSPSYVSHGFLNIPSIFRKSYMNQRRATARLQYSNKWWVVNVKGYDSRIFYFTGGWKTFVKENNFQVGDVCSFELIEKDEYVFKVSIARGKSREIGGLNSRAEGSKGTVEANIEDASSKFICKCPSFQIILNPSYVSKGYLNIPSNFRKSYMNQDQAAARLQHATKWWVVNVKGYRSGTFHFSGGWIEFVKENNLQVGDVCSFELIEKEKYVFKVSIARGCGPRNSISFTISEDTAKNQNREILIAARDTVRQILLRTASVKEKVEDRFLKIFRDGILIFFRT